MSQKDGIVEKTSKLGARIKNTSTVRFAASKRIRFNYAMANLTVVILSLWAILYSFILASDLSELYTDRIALIEAVGVMLPVFIVVFSLIEGGQNLVRAHLMELNARLLRELGDQLFAEKEKANGNEKSLISVFEKFSDRYNQTLERSPINHDDIDHWGKSFLRKRESCHEFRFRWWYYSILAWCIWLRRQAIRIVYVLMWCIPAPLLL